MKIIITNKERRDHAINQLKEIREANCPLELTLEPYIEKLSDPQRSKFHVLVREISRVSGYSEAEVKELVKKAILGTKIIMIGDTRYEVTSSSELNDQGQPRSLPSYSELIEGCFKIAAAAGIQLA